MKTIPWSEAQAFAEKWGQDQVIIWSFGPVYRQNVLTYGKTVQDSDQAAQGGNYIKGALLNWPECQACDSPDRVLVCLNALKEAKDLLDRWNEARMAPRESALGRVRQQLNRALLLFPEPPKGGTPNGEAA